MAQEKQQQQQNLIEMFKKNKLLAFGVPAILLILLLDTFVLRPARRQKELEKKGIKVTRPAATATASSASGGAKTVARAPINEPAPIAEPVYPNLSENIVSRFSANTSYPYSNGRNIFMAMEAPEPVEVLEDIPEQIVEEIIERPNISYHGFFTVGNDKVAILRNSDEVLLTKVGTRVNRTPFRLASISPEKVVISDVNEILRDFEIGLSDAEEPQPDEERSQNRKK